MSESFDPYRKWLGIPPDEQPPDHYRLLGVGRFESDPDVIANAADRQMAHVRTFQSGQRSELSQKILNELAAAKVRLLDAAKKAEYDDELRAETARAAPPAALPRARSSPAGPKPGSRTEAAAPRAAKSAALATAEPLIQDLTGLGASPNLLAKRRAPVRKKSKAPLIAGVATAAIAAAVVVIALNSNSSGDRRESDKTGNTLASNQSEKSLDVKTDAKTNTVTSKTDEPKTRDISQPKTDVKTPIRKTEPKTTKTGPDPRLPPDPTDKTKTTDDMPPDDKQPTVDPDVVAPKNDTPKPPVPDAKTLAEARKHLNRLYDDQFKNAKTADQKKELIKNLYAEAEQVNDDPAKRFVLLEKARDLGADLANAEVCFMIIDVMAEKYAVDGPEMKSQALARVIRSPLATDKKALELYKQAETVFVAAVEQRRFDVAVKAATMAKSLARRAKDAAAIRSVEERIKQVEAYEKEQESFDRASKTLADQPDDPAANLVAGRYYCLVRQDWEQGLPLIAKGSDEAMRQLAVKDLAAPTDAKAQVALAEDWRELGKKKPGIAKTAFLERAITWYQRAASQSAGLEKGRIERIIEEIQRTLKTPT